MSASFVVSLAVVVVLVLGARFLMAGLPLRRHARPLTVADALLVVVGVAGLALHCGSMFAPGVVDALPGTGGAADEIRALGTASIVWYAVPAVLVLLGLRRQHPAAVTALTLALAGVGVTMYDGGSLPTHLTAIFVSVVVLTGVASTLVIPPSKNLRRSRSTS